MRLLKNIPVLIAFLAASALADFGLSQQVFATESNDEPLDYFEMEQEAGTSGGTTKRYIDVSSAWSGGYIHENMTVEGKAEIKESFSMNNIKPSSGSSQNSGTGNVDSGESGNQDSDQGNSPGAVENNPNSSSDPGSVADNDSGSGNDPKPELETMAIPEWAELF